MANILFYSAGRRVDMARRFEKRGHNIIFAEFNDECPAAEAGFNVIHPVSYGYEEMARLCKEYNIQLVIPFSCKSASDLSYSEKYGDAIFLGATDCANYTCYNKQSFAEDMERLLPDYYPSPIKNQPKIWKPIKGNSSNGFMVAPDGFPCPTGFVEQDRLYGIEYTVDGYISRTGLFMGGVCRTRERIAGGEVLDSSTINNPELVRMAKSIGEVIGIKGPYCTQFMMDREGLYKCIETNARFGGGYTLSLEASLPTLDFIEEEYLNGFMLNESDIWTYTDDYETKMRRSYRDHFFYGK